MFGAGLVVGYVAGAAAGRERYEQIVGQAQRLASETGLVAARDRLGTRTSDVARAAVDEVTHASREVVENATDRVDRGLLSAQDAISTAGASS